MNAQVAYQLAHDPVGHDARVARLDVVQRAPVANVDLTRYAHLAAALAGAQQAVSESTVHAAEEVGVVTTHQNVWPHGNTCGSWNTSMQIAQVSAGAGVQSGANTTGASSTVSHAGSVAHGTVAPVASRLTLVCADRGATA